MLRHPKFKNERVCDGCGCSFLPEKGYEKVQKMCLGCSELPELPKETEGIVESKQKSRRCKKCGEFFVPTSPANTICKVCLGK